RRIASELRRERWGAILVSHNGVWRCLRRHGLNTRAKRLALVAGYAAPYQPPREPEPQRHVEAARPGELGGMDCFFVGRLQGTKGSVWQLTAIDVASSFAWAELVTCPRGQPTGEQTSKLARRVCAELAEAGWRLERVLSDNGGEFRSRDFRPTLPQLHLPPPPLPPHPPAPPPTTRPRPRPPPPDPQRRRAAPLPPLPPRPLPRPQAPPQPIRGRLHPPPAPPRPPHKRPHPRRHRLRCPQGEDEMSRN